MLIYAGVCGIHGICQSAWLCGLGLRLSFSTGALRTCFPLRLCALRSCFVHLRAAHVEARPAVSDSVQIKMGGLSLALPCTVHVEAESAVSHSVQAKMEGLSLVFVLCAESVHRCLHMSSPVLGD